MPSPQMGIVPYNAAKVFSNMLSFIRSESFCKGAQQILYQQAGALKFGYLLAQPGIKINIIAAVGIGLFEVFLSLQNFFKGNITGKQCMKQISGTFAKGAGALGGGLAGGAIGSAVGSLVGPFGQITGFLVGSIIGTGIGHFIGGIINEKIWEMFSKESPEDEIKKKLLDNAFTTLGLTNSASNEQIVQSWREQILRYHPDKNMDATPEQKLDFQNRFMGIHSAFCLIREHRKNMGNPISTADIKKRTGITIQNDHIDD